MEQEKNNSTVKTEEEKEEAEMVEVKDVAVAVVSQVDGVWCKIT